MHAGVTLAAFAKLLPLSRFAFRCALITLANRRGDNLTLS
jgi:hypothetical protein